MTKQASIAAVETGMRSSSTSDSWLNLNARSKYFIFARDSTLGNGSSLESQKEHSVPACRNDVKSETEVLSNAQSLNSVVSQSENGV
jgi:hypothetical protein